MKILKDKIVIVTGGNGLLGKSIISDIEKKGGIPVNFEINLKTNFDRNEIFCDITETDSILNAIKSTYKYYGRIDGLVNNAYPRTEDWGVKFEDIPKTSWDKNVQDQLNSYFFLCQQIVDLMKEQGAGSIVNMSSIYGIVGPDFSIYENTDMTMPAAYSAIKGAIINFSRYLASYLGSYGIRVNCISPGGIINNQNALFIEKYEKKVPLRRMGRPGDIAPSVSFLLSDEASYITGHNLVVDGGWTAI